MVGAVAGPERGIFSRSFSYLNFSPADSRTIHPQRGTTQTGEEKKKEENYRKKKKKEKDCFFSFHFTFYFSWKIPADFFFLFKFNASWEHAVQDFGMGSSNEVGKGGKMRKWKL